MLPHQKLFFKDSNIMSKYFNQNQNCLCGLDDPTSIEDEENMWYEDDTPGRGPNYHPSGDISDIFDIIQYRREYGSYDPDDVGST
jgi:hypothetical protein